MLNSDKDLTIILDILTVSFFFIGDLTKLIFQLKQNNY